MRLDEYGYVYGSLAGVESAPPIGLIAHVDTSPDVTGTDVNPQVHEGYDGGVIELPGDPSVVLDPAELPLLKKKIGHDIVTTDGTTLLGADDKAGVAEIVAAVAYLKRNPDLEHAPIRVCFTVDEEVAGGADHLEIERYGAKYAYTLDGVRAGRDRGRDVQRVQSDDHDPGPLDPPRHGEGTARERGEARRRSRCRRYPATLARPRPPRSARVSCTRRRSPVEQRRRRSSSSSATTTPRRCTST